jgi:ABC-2 type transport system ATP-binding protein
MKTSYKIGSPLTNTVNEWCMVKSSAQLTESLFIAPLSASVELAVDVVSLRKTYGKTIAVDDVSLKVPRGAFFALLGPNGAGKTTMLEILEGLRTRDAGSVSVLGMDPQTAGIRLKQRVGVQLQTGTLHDKLSVWEHLRLFGSFYKKTADLPGLLDRFALRQSANVWFSNLSSGQKQRLALALAMIGEPEIVFLDEPTVGLDPEIRAEIHGLLLDLQSSGVTIVMTTHYIEEAERLADRVGFINKGRIVASGAKSEILDRYGSARRVFLKFGSRADVDALRALPYVQEATEFRGFEYVLRCSAPDDVVAAVTSDPTLPRCISATVSDASLEVIYMQMIEMNK